MAVRLLESGSIRLLQPSASVLEDGRALSDVRATFGEDVDPVGDGPQSHDTAGDSPADDVAATHDAD